MDIIVLVDIIRNIYILGHINTYIYTSTSKSNIEYRCQIGFHIIDMT